MYWCRVAHRGAGPVAATAAGAAAGAGAAARPAPVVVTTQSSALDNITLVQTPRAQLMTKAEAYVPQIACRVSAVETDGDGGAVTVLPLLVLIGDEMMACVVLNLTADVDAFRGARAESRIHCECQ